MLDAPAGLLDSILVGDEDRESSIED